MTELRRGRQITVEATPDPITIDTAQTAVTVVDMQNDFRSKGGMFDRAGVDISMVQKAVEPTRKVLVAARDAQIKIIYLKMGFRPDLSDLGDEDSPNRVRHLQFGVGQANRAPDGREGQFLIRDTWNTDILAELGPEPDDVVLYKDRFSGFFQTKLDDILRGLAIKDLIFTGCNNERLRGLDDSRCDVPGSQVCVIGSLYWGTDRKRLDTKQP